MPNLVTVRHMEWSSICCSKKASIERKQKMAVMNNTYLEQVMLAGINGTNKN